MTTTWKSTEVLLRQLIDIASKGGNYLLNVGPTAEGVIPEPSVERLKAIGAMDEGQWRSDPWHRPDAVRRRGRLV